MVHMAENEAESSTTVGIPTKTVDTLLMAGPNSSRVFNPRRGCKCPVHFLRSVPKRPSLELKTRAGQLVGSLPLDVSLPGQTKLFMKTLFNLSLGVGRS